MQGFHQCTCTHTGILSYSVCAYCLCPLACWRAGVWPAADTHRRWDEAECTWNVWAERCFLLALLSVFTLGFIFADRIFVVKKKTLCWQRPILISHLPFMVLKRRIPSAGPQIWIRSSLLILKRSAPATAAEHLFSFHLLFKNIMHFLFFPPWLSHSAVCLVLGFLTHYLWSWRRALRKVRTCDGAATAECPVVRTMAEGATCQKEEEPLKWV